MKKVIAFILVLVMALTLCACGSKSTSTSTSSPATDAATTTDAVTATEGNDYSYHWKLATTEAPDYYMTKLSQEFLDRVNELSGGKVTGEVFASGQLGGLTDMLEGLEVGTIDIVMDGFSSLGEANELFNVWGMPYLYDDQDHKHNFWDNYFDECADLVAKESNIRMVTVIDGLNRNLCCKQPVESLADLKGLKIRVPTIATYVKVWESFGAAATPMSLSEVYTSLSTGVIDGQENDIMLTMAENFYEVAPYAIMTEHVPYEASLFFNEETYQSFPDELKQIIKQAGEELIVKSRETVYEAEAETLAKMEEMGVTIIRPDLTEWREAVQVMYEDVDYMKPVLDLIDAARA